MSVARPDVILVHGLWFGPWSMSWLARKLQAAGFNPHRHAYATTGGQLDDHARKLAEFVRQSNLKSVHFIGHSLGGLVILRMLNENPELPPGRVLLLGSPVDGSVVARRSRRIPGGRKLLGRVHEALEQGYGKLPPGHETGMISGTRAVGIGSLMGGAGKPGDGTVAVAETRTTGLKDHLLLPVNHTGMLFSPEVARQAAIFLETGSFDWPGAC